MSAFLNALGGIISVDSVLPPFHGRLLGRSMLFYTWLDYVHLLCFGRLHGRPCHTGQITFSVRLLPLLCRPDHTRLSDALSPFRGYSVCECTFGDFGC